MGGIFELFMIFGAYFHPFNYLETFQDKTAREIVVESFLAEKLIPLQGISYLMLHMPTSGEMSILSFQTQKTLEIVSAFQIM